MSLLIFTFYYFILSFSVIGYGYIASKTLKIKLDKNQMPLMGIIGLIFLTFISYVTNIFTPHNFIHNLFFLFIGLLLFLRLVFKDSQNKFPTLFFLFISIVFFFSLMAKTHDDFGWYHLPYTLNLSQSKFQFGLGHFNHGFKTASSIFYLNSMFYLPSVKHFTFNFAQIYCFSFALYFFLQNAILKKNNSVLSIYSILSFIFISVVFYRLSEHGTDRSGQILIFLILYFLIDFLLKKKLEFFNLAIISILLIYIFTIKNYFIIYFLLLIPFLKPLFKNFEFLKKFIKSNLFIFIFIFLIFHFNIQVANSGCFLYPMEITCIDSLKWSFSADHLSYMSQHYELWAKAGANPNFRVENPSEYISSLNWVPFWFDQYFFNKVSDTLLGVLFISLIVYFLFRPKFNINNYKKLIILYFILFAIFSLWFFKFPQLRYGGFSILANLFFVPIAFLFFQNFIDQKYLNKVKYILAIAFVVFIGRNLDRINSEHDFYSYNPLTNPYYKILTDKIEYDEIQLADNIKINITKYVGCWDLDQPCSHRETIKAIQKFGYIIYYE